MSISITNRLFLAILAAALLSVACMFVIMQWSIDRGFLNYVNTMEQTRLARLAERLEESYARQGSWEFLKDDRRGWRRLVADSFADVTPDFPERRVNREPPPPPHEEVGPPPGKFGPPPGLPPPGWGGPGFDMRVFLLDSGKQKIIGPPAIPVNMELKPLTCQNHRVGYLGLVPHKRLSDERQVRFLKEQNFALGLIGGMVLLLAAGVSLPLANRLVRPIRALAAATDRLAAGEFSVRLPVASADELGQLARDFNTLALTLGENEKARQQWVADISHELRTPLAILRGEIEALQDGVRQTTPESLRSLHGEVMRLSRLVDDLYQLSLSDLGALTYRKEELDLARLVTEALAPYRQECAARNIALSAHIPLQSVAVIFGDRERLRQLFANLLDNALKYTDAPGKIAVRLVCRAGEATVDIEDSPPGVASGDLERLFDRLYRVDSSRSRAAGGAGLGLSICRNIVEAHSGTIVARQSNLGGIWVRVTLPLAEGCR